MEQVTKPPEEGPVTARIHSAVLHRVDSSVVGHC